MSHFAQDFNMSLYLHTCETWTTKICSTKGSMGLVGFRTASRVNKEFMVIFTGWWLISNMGLLSTGIWSTLKTQKKQKKNIWAWNRSFYVLDNLSISNKSSLCWRTYSENLLTTSSSLSLRVELIWLRREDDIRACIFIFRSSTFA